MPPDPVNQARITQGAGREMQHVEDQPDPRTIVEADTLDLAKAQAEIVSLRQDIAERKKYAGRIFWLISCWVAGLFILLGCEGFGAWPWLKFSIPVTVMLATIGSTTINVLGLFYIVAHYLFPERSFNGKSHRLPGNASPEHK